MSSQELAAPMTPLEQPRALNVEPSAWRAWRALVWLSWQRQARARQMVWIALSLLVFAVVFVAINTAADRWSMNHWQSPGRNGPTYPTWVNHTQIVTGIFHPSPAAHGLQHAVLGSVNAIITPTMRDTSGKLVNVSGFEVFTQSIILLMFLTFLLPVWSLSFATEAVGGDRESQSLIWLLSRPLSRPAIYLAKFVALLPWSLGLNLGGFALMCMVAGPSGRMALALYWPAVIWATLAFAALFLLFGAYFRRPAVVAIIYSFCLEVVLGSMPGYLKRVSIGFYTRCLMYDQLDKLGIEPDRAGVFLPVTGTTAMLVLILGTLTFLGAGVWIFSRMQYHEVD